MQGDIVSELVKLIQNAHIGMHGYNEYTAKMFVRVILISETYGKLQLMRKTKRCLRRMNVRAAAIHSKAKERECVAVMMTV